jgi:hypothetical protein
MTEMIVALSTNSTESQVEQVTVRRVNPRQAKVSLSQAVRSLGNRLQGHKPLGGWLARFTDHNGQRFDRRLAWLVIARGIKFPVLRGPAASTARTAAGSWAEEQALSLRHELLTE